MEWFTEKKSMPSDPSCTWSPERTSRKLGFLMRCSSNLPAMKPSVSFEEKIGTLGLRSARRYGSAPVWSSWPWVTMMPRSLCSFSRT